MADTDTSSYEYEEWKGGEVITADKLNHIEEGIAKITNSAGTVFVGVHKENEIAVGGALGLVPAPPSDAGGKFLSAEGNWKEVETPDRKVEVTATGAATKYNILLRSNDGDASSTYTAVSSDKVSVKDNVITAEGFSGPGALLTNLNGSNIADGTIGANYLPKLNQIDNQNTQTSTITQGIIADIETNHLSATGNKLKIKFLKKDFKVSDADVGKVLMVDNEGDVALSSVKFASAEAGF